MPKKTKNPLRTCPAIFRPNGDWGPFIEEDGIHFRVSDPDPEAEYFERSDAWDRWILIDPDFEFLGGAVPPAP